eukprot:363694-Chlamydomonas_euryale.AAC.18
MPAMQRSGPLKLPARRGTPEQSGRPATAPDGCDIAAVCRRVVASRRADPPGTCARAARALRGPLIVR